MAEFITYRHKIAGWIACIFLAVGTTYAGSDQSMAGLTARSLGTGLGDTSPAVAFNSKAKNYLVLYAKNDATCGQQRLFAKVIDGISGIISGADISISDCNVSIADPQVVYNAKLDEYLIFYKSIGNTPNKSNIFYCSIDATTYQFKVTNVSLANSSFSDPFRTLNLAHDTKNGLYALGYHMLSGGQESSLLIRYVDENSKALKTHQTSISITDFSETNLGVFQSKLIFNGSNLMPVFELRLTSGSEIWGGIVNTVSGALVNNIFLISPQGSDYKNYINPGAVYNQGTDETIVAFEEAYYSDPVGGVRLSKDIYIQRILAANGNLAGSPVKMPALPPAMDFEEDKKFPVLSISYLSQEIIAGYYGMRFNADSDRHNIYLHRLNQSDLALISTTSILVEQNVGKQLEENDKLKAIGLVHNEPNNQFNLVWMKDSNKEIKTQIWRYNNNPPTNLSLSTSAQNENMPIGSVFATMRADDPDPEDAAPVFSFVSGVGGVDNSYFTIDQNLLKIAKKLNFEESATRSVKIRATDTHGAFTEKVFVLTINDINEAPYDILLSGNLSVEENSLAFSSTITVKDEDFGDTHTLALVAGDSSANNSNFEIISGNILKIKKTLNYEENPVAYIRIRATDAIGLLKEKGFSIQVIDVNEPMENMYLMPESLPENDPDAFVTVVIIDPDAQQDYTISLTEGTGDDDNTFFVPVDNKLKVSRAFDYETKNLYKIRVRAKEGAYIVDKEFTISVIDVNDAPDSITISENQIMDGRGAGYAIGKIFTYDQDAGDEHSLSLTKGSDIFLIDTNDSLITKIPLIYNYSNPAANFYNITIRSEDKAGSAISKTLDIEVIPFSDTEKPRILNFENNEKYIFADANRDFTISINATDNEKLEAIYFYYRQIRSDQPFKLSDKLMQVEENEKFFRADVSLNTSEMDEMGIEYYFEVVDAAENTAVSPSGYAYKMFESKVFTPTGKSYSGEANSYRIVTNPYKLGSGNNRVSKIFSDYGSSSGKTWRLFKYEGQENVEIGKSTSATLDQGSGYWFNKMPLLEDAIVLDNAQTPENHAQKEFSMQLKIGWNLIGNPYPFYLDWNDVRNYNGFTGNNAILYTFEGQYREATGLNIFEGGFVYSDRTTELKFPITKHGPSGRIAQNEPTGYEWLVNLTLENRHLRNQLSGIGMHELASENYDEYDRPLLPRFIYFADIAFEYPDQQVKDLSRDITSTSKQHIWEFTATSNAPERQFKLSWNKPDFKISDKRLILYDINHDISTDMSDVQSYTVDLSVPVAFKAIYGDKAFIEATLSEARVQAMSPYPNPFSDEVTLPLILPQTGSNYKVEYSIFNLLGEKVFAKSEERITNGVYSLKWNNHRELPNGIYIYSIKVKNTFLTKEFHGRIVKN
jgi:hypothetical protein